MSTFGVKLKLLREERGETQEDIARVLKISRTSISKYESGDREPDIETIKILSKHFGVSVDFIFGLNQISSPSENDDVNHVAGAGNPPVNTVHSTDDDEIRQLINDKRFIRLARKISDNHLDIGVIESLIDNVIILNKDGKG